MQGDAEHEGLEPVFIAANIREVEAVAQLFAAEGIEYQVRPHEFLRQGFLFSGEFGGLLFEVLPGQAYYCRKLLLANNLSSGIVEREVDANFRISPQ